MKLTIQFTARFLARVKKTLSEQEIDDIGSWPDCDVVFQDGDNKVEVRPDICFSWFQHVISYLSHQDNYYEDIWGIPFYMKFNDGNFIIFEKKEELKEIFRLEISKDDLISLFNKSLVSAVHRLEEINPALKKSSTWKNYLYE